MKSGWGNKNGQAWKPAPTFCHSECRVWWQFLV